MSALAEIRLRNLFLAYSGVNFVWPFFRKLMAQMPVNVNKYTIYSSSKEKRENEFKNILKKEKGSFVLILRDDNAVLDEVLFVPSPDIIDCREVREKRANI